ncbi:RNA-binding component of cleavage and polyadenylation factor [Tulasnella sp. UAMH 9824]|nr:RNA-binding component of cleavage and polyadenylation factor [Tulasnella sp. UAMH 9824]
MSRVTTLPTSDAITQQPTVADVLRPDFHQLDLKVEHFIKGELGVKLDKDDQICRANLSPTGCPLGPLRCPQRHTDPSPLNFQSKPIQNTFGRDRPTTVCKHWLRGLCKKGDACEFLHEYNLRRMPECWWFARYGYCTSGDECLYAHPKERKKECPDYKRGFCRLGPDCPRKHVRRVACKLFLSGFCPMGPDCPQGHPKPSLPTAEDYRPPSPPSPRDIGPPPPGFGRYFGDEGNQGGGFSGNAGPSGGGGFGGGGNFVSRPRADGTDGMPYRRNLEDVTCFKCGQRGHYANVCKNANVPGDRGGLGRRRDFQKRDD